MSKLTRRCLRVPRLKSLFGIIGLQTATELLSLALVFNKATGFYGLLAILTGYQLSLLQFSTYLYSIGVLAALVFLLPHIRRQSPFECLALAWLYILDTAINGIDTAVFGLEWYVASASSNAGATTSTTMTMTEHSLPDMVASSIAGLRQESAVHGSSVSHETALSMVLIVGLTLTRVYFSMVVMAYAQQVLHKYTQILALEGADGVDGHEGPFALDLPDGEGRRGRMGRLMVSFGNGYWLEKRGAESWEAYTKGADV